MCLVAFAIDVHPKYRLVLISNRDERFDRPAAPLARWADAPAVVAGRDLDAGGTWLGVAEHGRWAVLTNVRDPQNPRDPIRSRGCLAADFLTGSASASGYAERVFDSRGDYDGFNLVVGDLDGVFVVSTHTDHIAELGRGVYGLSNAQLDTSWPKVVRTRTALRSALEASTDAPEDLLPLLDDTRQAPDDDLPDTGVGLRWERLLSPVRIVTEGYGTRASTVVLLDRAGLGTLTEQTWLPVGEAGRLTQIQL